MKPKREWPAVVGELVLIILGVLLAFAIEARWQDAQDAQRRAGYLASVEEELRSNRAQLQAALELVEGFRNASDSLVALTREPSQVADSVRSRLLWRATSVGAIRPSMVALNGLLASTV